MIGRNQLAAELGAWATQYLEDAAWDTQGFADEVLSLFGPMIREAKAEAWDEGFNRALFEATHEGYRAAPNPYRADAEEGS